MVEHLPESNLLYWIRWRWEVEEEGCERGRKGRREGGIPNDSRVPDSRTMSNWHTALPLLLNFSIATSEIRTHYKRKQGSE